MKKLLILFLVISINACSQNNRTILGEDAAKEELNLALSKQSQHNVVDNKTKIIKEGKTAIAIAELILFEIYGKRSIESQKPYETYLINNHWVISGTLPQNYDGGTFLLILDANNAKIIKISHGK